MVIICRSILLRMRNLSDSSVNKIKTQNQNPSLCPVTFYVFGNRALYEIMWKNVIVPGTPQMKI